MLSLLLVAVFAAGPFEVSSLKSAELGEKMALQTARLAPSARVKLFDAPLSGNGFTPAAPSGWANDDVPAPTLEWWGNDPTGGSSLTNMTCSANGTPETARQTPYCRDGSWDDVTTGDCMEAVQFDTASVEYYNCGSVGEFGDGDMSVCVVVMSQSDSINHHAIGKRSNGAGFYGWGIQHTGGASDQVYFYVNTTGGLASAGGNLIMPKNSYHLICGTADYDGNVDVYLNGTRDVAGTAAHTGTSGSSGGAPLLIGELRTGVTGSWTGHILWAALWDDVVLTQAQITDLLNDAAGIKENNNTPVSLTNSGPNCCWISGKLSCAGDNWPLLGCQMAPNTTGAGSPSTSIMLSVEQTNSVLYARDLSNVAWSQSGSPNPTANRSDLFRDSRQTYKVTDDSGAAGEFVYQDITHGLSNGDDVTVCIYATADSSQYLDSRFYESGGTCSGGATAYEVEKEAVGTSWEQFSWTHTIVDDTCTDIRVYIIPYDTFQGNAVTGHVEAVMQVFLGQSWCPQIFVETQNAGVACGDDVLLYDISGTNLASGMDGRLISFDYTPIQGSPLDTGNVLVRIDDSGTAVDFYFVLWQSDGTLALTGRSTEEGATRTMAVTDSAWNPTAGTTYTIKVSVDSSASAISVDTIPQPVTNVTLTNAPDSLDRIWVGVASNGSGQANGLIANVWVK